MIRENSLAVKVCARVSKYSIFALAFLMPVFFLPWTADVLDFNKQALMLALVLISLFAWMLKALLLSKVQVFKNKINIAAGALFLVYFLATVFSIYGHGSFWGWPQSSSNSLLSLTGFLLVYFLISNIFSRKDVSALAVVFCASAFLAQLFGILQLFGLYIAPFDFAKKIYFNTIGSVGSLGFFTAILLPILTALLVLAKKWWKIFFTAQIILSAALLLLINYKNLWWAVFLGSVLMLIFGASKRNFFDAKWMALPIFFLTVSVFFMLLSPQIPDWSPRVNEIYLSQLGSLKIDLGAVKEKPFLGSGPGTFSYDFLKFKNAGFSSSSAWNANFSEASSKILTDLATTGILGFLALLAMLALPVFYGIKFLISQKAPKASTPAEKDSWVLVLGFAVSVAVAALTHFLYNFNIVLTFFYFFVVACLALLIPAEKKEYDLKPSSFPTLVITFSFTLAFILGLGLLILNGQRYVAEASYLKGISFMQQDRADEGIKGLEFAAKLNSSSDLYLRQLSQVYLAKAQQEIDGASTSLTDEQKNKIQTLIANSINAGKLATDINPKSAENWASRGYAYQAFFGLIADSEKWAISSYDEAIKLDPNNPYLFAQEGNVNFVASLRADAGQKQQLLETAKEKLEKAVSLNPSYSNALYSLGLVYDDLGQKLKAIEVFEKVQQLNPENTALPKILANLRTGLPALQQPAPLPETLPETPLGQDAPKLPESDAKKP